MSEEKNVSFTYRNVYQKLDVMFKLVYEIVHKSSYFFKPSRLIISSNHVQLLKCSFTNILPESLKRVTFSALYGQTVIIHSSLAPTPLFCPKQGDYHLFDQALFQHHNRTKRNRPSTITCLYNNFPILKVIV